MNNKEGKKVGREKLKTFKNIGKLLDILFKMCLVSWISVPIG